MRSIAQSMLAFAILGATALPLSVTGAQAMPAAQPLPLAEAAPPVILTAGGCGPGFHRGFYGACRPNYGFGFHRWGWHRGWGWHRHWHRWY